MSIKVLVSGATGQQGGSVLNALLERGNQVVGITRNTDSDKARALKDRGVEMISLNFNDEDAVAEAMSNVDAVFALTTPFEEGVEAETAQGISLANAAKKSGVKHFIFNSVADADRSTGIPHFDSKYEVEKHIESLGIPYTIVAPVYFMENLLFPFVMDDLKNGNYKLAMPADVKLQQISSQDIGKFVAEVANNRGEFLNKRINIAGDELSGNESAEILSNLMGKEVVYEGFDPEYMRAQSEDMAAMYEWFNSTGYSADVQGLKKYGFMDFEQWASQAVSNN